MSCAACSTAILPDEEFLRCALEDCGKLYHHLCAGGRIPTHPKTLWECPECRCAAKKGGDNSLTPVGNSKKRDLNVTHRNRSNTPVTPNPGPRSDNADFAAVSSDIRSLREEIASLKIQLGLALSTITTYEAKLEGYGAHVQALHHKIVENEARCICSVNVCSETTENSSEKQHNRKNDNRSCDLSGRDTSTANHSRKGSSRVKTSYSRGNIALQETISTEQLSGEENQTFIEPSGGNWIDVSKKSSRNAPIGVIRGAAGPGSTKLVAAERRRQLHLYYLKVGTTGEDIREHLDSFCDGSVCTITELKARGNYASFKLDVPSKLESIIMSSENWAEDICIKPWRQSFRPKVKEGQKL